jgi:hypothetical protein
VVFTKNDALQAEDHWKTTFTFNNSHHRMLCTSVLQGEALQSQGHAHDADLLTAYLFPSGLPRKLAQYTPDYFPVVDSGATVHVLWDSVCTAYTKEANSAIKWGGVDSDSVCTSIGHLNAVTYCKDNNNRGEMIMLTSGCDDTWKIPNANRLLFSQVRAKLQGHKCILEGPNPGMLIADTKDFIPFVTEEETGYCLLPMFPPPSYTTRHTGIYSNSMRVINMNSGNNSATALSFNPLVKRILLNRSIAKRLFGIRNDVRQNMRVSKEAKRNKLAKKSIISEKRKIAEEKLLLKEKLSQRNYKAHHTACGHAHLKRTIAFKRNGKLIASKLPSKFLRDYQKKCAICLATEKRRKSTPKANSNFTEDLVPWEETYADSSGKFRTKSKRGNYYFTVFVDAKTGDKIVICHAKRKHFPVVYFTFINRIGHPKVLYTDLASEMTSDDFERYLLVKGVNRQNHIPVPRGEHHGIGVAEEAIQDLSNMMRSYLTDSNLPGIKSRTIFEHVWGVVPNLDLIPPIGIFAARLMDNSARTDWKLDPKNQSGVFLGFAHNRNVYGAQILVENAIITAKLKVAYDTELFPFHQRDNSNPRMQFLTWFIKYAQNIKGHPPLIAEAILESGAFHTMTIVPKDQCVYASCVYPVECLIIVMYVDNNGIRHNCNELLTAFESDVAADGSIDLHREGDMSSFLSVRYLNNTQTGEITADQESYIDTLLEQYNMTNANPNKVPLKTSVNLAEIASRLPKTPDRELVSLYCKFIGELMFVAINTQP